MGKLKEKILEMFFPSGIKCVLCGTELSGKSGNILCSNCSLPTNNQFCKKCGRALSAATDYCFECQNFYSPISRGAAPFLYQDGAKKLVKSLKFGNSRFLADFMAESMSDCFLLNKMQADFVTFVPMTAKKQKARGYNQAELLAKSVAKRLNLPCLSVLNRVREGKNTARLRRYQRKELIEGSVSVIDGVDFCGKTALLVDDVFTTGTTATECAKNLLSSGVSMVSVLTFATSKMLPKGSHID